MYGEYLVYSFHCVLKLTWLIVSSVRLKQWCYVYACYLGIIIVITSIVLDEHMSVEDALS
jgi:hypothetical protein